MSTSTHDFQLVIASVNGSGSLTANRILHKALQREAYQTVGKNLFPSNIEGLPTYYFLRISESSQSLKTLNNIYVGLNPATLNKDLKEIVNSETHILLNSDLKMNIPDNYKVSEYSFKSSLDQIKAPIKIKKRISNLFYVGWLSHFLGLSQSTFFKILEETFVKPEIIEQNKSVYLSGWDSFSGAPLKLKPTLTKKQILIEGNQAAALGWVDAGCQVATWYPITPSTSLVESFEEYAKKLRPEKNSVAVLQSEDEISAVSSVVGAGWAGARAATATSGPGLSLMAEAIGLAYFTEVPAVIWDVQRVGPSTGLPTRTSQADLEFAYKISHGDTKHPLLLPSSPEECYHMAGTAFDIADKYQTPVLVLSDLDLGMNIWSSDIFTQNTKKFDRSNILAEAELEALKAEGLKFKRYLGNAEGVPQRTLPGTHHPDAAYFTRGSGHNESANYSESPADYENKISRLKLKIESARKDLPKALIKDSKNDFGIIYYGSTQQIFPELFDLIPDFKFDLCKINSLPLHQEVFDFISAHKKVFVVEQNRDGQMKNIISQECTFFEKDQLVSILNFDGWSIQADKIAQKIISILTSTPLFTSILNVKAASPSPSQTKKEH